MIVILAAGCDCPPGQVRDGLGCMAGSAGDGEADGGTGSVADSSSGAWAGSTSAEEGGSSGAASGPVSSSGEPGSSAAATSSHSAAPSSSAAALSSSAAGPGSSSASLAGSSSAGTGSSQAAPPSSWQDSSSAAGSSGTAAPPSSGGLSSSSSEPGAFSDAGAGSTSAGAASGDSSSSSTEGGADAGASCPGTWCLGTCCEAGQGCHGGQCVPELAGCGSGQACQDDSYCDGLACIPFGSGPGGESAPACTRLVPLGLFSPSIQCEWPGSGSVSVFPNHRNVLVTPLVMDFDFDSDPATLRPSVVFTSYNFNDGGSQACVGTATEYGVIRVMDGNTCQLQFTLGDVHVVGSATPALADLDGDGRAEIVAAAVGGGIVIYRYNPLTGAWTSRRGVTAAATPATSTWAAGQCNWAGVSVFDVDGAADGLPEILLGGWVYSAAGVEMAPGRWITTASTGQIPVVADVDLDGKMELVDGARVYKWAAATGWTAAWGAALAEGYSAVADFGDYPPATGLADVGYPEIVVVNAGTVSLYSHRGTLLWGPADLPTLPGGTCVSGGVHQRGWGGPPTIGDFDGDGQPEIAVAGGEAFAVFDPRDCVGPTLPAGCVAVGLRWARVSKDCSSNRTGSSIFDFEADGRVEAVYADECYARVYDGETGAVLFSQPHTSCTWNENVIIADVDGDYRSEMVVPANNNCGVGCSAAAWSPDPAFPGLRCAADEDCPSLAGCVLGYCRCTGNAQCPPGGTYACAAPLAGTPGAGNVCRSTNLAAAQGIRIYRDIQDRWANSRPTWNQHAYFVTNVDDHGGVPAAAVAPRNWATPGLNNFRQNVQGGVDPLASPDVTARAIVADCASGTALLRLAVCNRGAIPMAAGVPVAFYQGDPRAGSAVACVATTTASVIPGECTVVECSMPVVEGTVLDTWVRADDDGTGASDAAECDEGNNLARFPDLVCVE